MSIKSISSDVEGLSKIYIADDGALRACFEFSNAQTRNASFREVWKKASEYRFHMGASEDKKQGLQLLEIDADDFIPDTVNRDCALSCVAKLSGTVCNPISSVDELIERVTGAMVKTFAGTTADVPVVTVPYTPSRWKWDAQCVCM